MSDDIRHDWQRAEVEALFALPLNDLLFRAQSRHRRYFDPNRVQVSALLSIKTGGCSEDCSYCSQSARYDTGLERERLLGVEETVAAARAARAAGATRFCMGAAWRGPKGVHMERLEAMARAVKALGMECCMTLGQLSAEQAERLRDAGLDYYNHNLDTSPEFYPEIVSTHSWEDRLQTLAHVRAAGINVCSGGIVGMGESRADRAGLLVALANLPEHPGSVPINRLVHIPGTPLAETAPLDPLEFVRTIAVARILMPRAYVRLSAGRETLDDAAQALCFFAGANSIFSGERLLTAPNAGADRDQALFAKLGLQAEAPATACVAAADASADASAPVAAGAA